MIAREIQMHPYSVGKPCEFSDTYGYKRKSISWKSEELAISLRARTNKYSKFEEGKIDNLTHENKPLSQSPEADAEILRAIDFAIKFQEDEAEAKRIRDGDMNAIAAIEKILGVEKPEKSLPDRVTPVRII